MLLDEITQDFPDPKTTVTISVRVGEDFALVDIKVSEVFVRLVDVLVDIQVKIWRK